MNSNPQEAQQSQTIAEIKAEHDGVVADHAAIGRGLKSARKQIGVLLEIVDSQAQKITELTRARDEMTATAYRLGSEAQQHISEARKLAEKMRDASERPGGGHTFLPWEREP